MNSIIYSGLSSQDAVASGYFEPKDNFSRLSKNWDGRPKTKIDQSTQVVYFPGAFGNFHAGHLSIYKAAMVDYPNAVGIISPANSDYAVTKYGAWSNFASNKYRFDRIKQMVPRALIDTAPMLNFTCDHNFTDLLENFLQGFGLSIHTMQHKPVIAFGPDRAWFSELNNHTDKVIVRSYDEVIDTRTSRFPNMTRPKKRLGLRCSDEWEFLIFRAYFADQYTDIIPIYLKDEIAETKAVWKQLGATHTICKEYADFIPYIKLSRHFQNALDEPVFDVAQVRNIKPGMRILDSDVYTGATSRCVESQGAELITLLDLSEHQNEVELLDISDFYKESFAYPYVDISSRCSMQAFDSEFHNHFKNFKRELRHV